MFDKIMDFGYSLSDGYTAWIICTVLLFAFIMYKGRHIIYELHVNEKRIEAANKKNLNQCKYETLTDPHLIKVDKILCYIAASICCIAFSALSTKVVLYTLGLLLIILAGILQVVVFIAVIVIAILVLLVLI